MIINERKKESKQETYRWMEARGEEDAGEEEEWEEEQEERESGWRLEKWLEQTMIRKIARVRRGVMWKPLLETAGVSHIFFF